MANKIRIFSTPTCVWCNRAKEYLTMNKVKFEDLDVVKSKEAAKEMVKLTGQLGVPVLDINGAIIIGFDREAIDRELKKLK